MEAVLGIVSFIIDNAPLLVGVILPFAVEVINRDIHHEHEKFIITVAVCIITATLLHLRQLAAGSVDEILASASIIFAESQIVFKLYFKKSFFREAISTKKETSVVPPVTAGQETMAVKTEKGEAS